MLRLPSMLLLACLAAAQLSGPLCPSAVAAAPGASGSPRAVSDDHLHHGTAHQPEQRPHDASGQHPANHPTSGKVRGSASHPTSDGPLADTHEHQDGRACTLFMACGTLAPPRAPRPATAPVDERLDEQRAVVASPASNAPDLELPPPRVA